MPATRFLGPALGSLHMFFHRLGPVLARRLLLTGDTIAAGELAHLGVFTEVVDARRRRRPGPPGGPRRSSRMPADGIVMAKEAFRLVEQLQAYQGEEVLSSLFHAYGTNLQFDEGEFNFVKTRAEHGTKQAFELRDEHFEVPEPEPLRPRLSSGRRWRRRRSTRPPPAPSGSRPCRWRGAGPRRTRRRRAAP